jgi:hypothetical protein
MIKKIWAVAVACSVFPALGAGSALSQSSPRPEPWIVRLSPVKVAAVDSQNKATTLVVSCSKNGFGMEVLFNSKSAGWGAAKGDQPLRVGNRLFAMRMVGGWDMVHLSDRPEGGISLELLSAVGSRDPVVLEGAYAAGMALQARTFPSTGAEAAISRLKANCVLR